MLRVLRSQNLYLLRCRHGGATILARKLAGLTNAAYVSEMATGGREISDFEARQIERLLELPDGWMDRDNAAMFIMSKLDFDLYTAISGKSEQAKLGLLAFLGDSS